MNGLFLTCYEIFGMTVVFCRLQVDSRFDTYAMGVVSALKNPDFVQKIVDEMGVGKYNLKKFTFNKNWI